MSLFDLLLHSRKQTNKMGLIFSRFYDKPSTRDTLEKIEQELQNIEERRWDKIKREQFIVQILSFIPVTILIVNICILLYPSSSSLRDKLVLSIPIVLLNLVLWVCKKIVQWYSKWSLDNEEARLRKLQKEKKKILEMVCETESYKVATELLEKYDPKQLRRRERNSDRPASPMNTTLTKLTASPIRSPQQQSQTMQSPASFHNQSISFPLQSSIPHVPAPPPPTPISKISAPSTNNVNNQKLLSSLQKQSSGTNMHNTSVAPVIAASSVQGRPVRPILNKDRSIFERLVDWVVQDGPENRFALICKFCHYHNGMSLAEEFETITFRCCYCYNLNPASGRKTQAQDKNQSDQEKSDQQSAESSSVPTKKPTSKDSDNSETEKKKRPSDKNEPIRISKEATAIIKATLPQSEEVAEKVVEASESDGAKGTKKVSS